MQPNPVPQNYMIRSTDGGNTFSAPVDISSFLGDFVGIMPGPSSAVELSSGRLLFAGHYGPYQFDLTWWSDDDGLTWTISDDKLEGMDEVAVVELQDGRLMLNMRTNHLDPCNCRAVAISSDGGETFPEITYDPALIEPVCQGSIVSVNDALYFSNPNSTSARVDITVKKSVDDGATWSDGELIWADAGPGYSGLVGGGVSETQGGIVFERSDDRGDVISFALYQL